VVIRVGQEDIHQAQHHGLLVVQQELPVLEREERLPLRVTQVKPRALSNIDFFQKGRNRMV
jgi:hypothetical protein